MGYLNYVNIILFLVEICVICGYKKELYIFIHTGINLIQWAIDIMKMAP